MQFPLIGSCVLFGLYIVIKLVKKELLDALLSVYFALLGAFAVFGCLNPPLAAACGAEGMKRFEKKIHYKIWKDVDDEGADPIEISCSAFELALFVPCACGSVAYALTKKWWLNNLLGCAFSIQGIEMLALGSYAIGVILLCGLFVYDVFWVFGTEVMVSVAKVSSSSSSSNSSRSIAFIFFDFLFLTAFASSLSFTRAQGLNAPVKILFPKAMGVLPIPMS